LYKDCTEPGCKGKSNTNNLPEPTDLTKNPYGEKKMFKDATQKSALVVDSEIAIKFQPRAGAPRASDA
jgi:hypothetical protein